MVVKLGPGVLKIGNVGEEIDVSCQVNGMTITSDKDQGDSTTKLCGTVTPGSVAYTYALSGNVDQDIDNADGLFALSQASPGTEAPFTFTPNDDVGTTASGTVVIDPLDFGGDEIGADLTSDIEFAIVGKPTYDGYPEGSAEQSGGTASRKSKATKEPVGAGA